MRLAGDALHEGEHRGVAGPLERRALGQQLVEHHAEREQIGARIDRLAEHLLGRHVARRAER